MPLFSIAGSVVSLFGLLASWAFPSQWTFSAGQAFRLCGRLWFFWAILWLALAFLSRSNKRRENPWQRLQHVLPSVIGFLLIFNDQWRGSWLARPIFPDSPPLMSLCVALTLAGLLFAIWARFALGSNWSGSVTIKADHQLIRRGPYRFIRHPIYTGMLVALLATVITQQLLGGLLGFALIFAALYRKALREESFLYQEFGDSFAEHRRHTGMFLPRFS